MFAGLITFLYERFLYILGLILAIGLGLAIVPAKDAMFPTTPATITDQQAMTIQKMCQQLNPLDASNPAADHVQLDLACQTAIATLPANPIACNDAITAAFAAASTEGLPDKDNVTPNQVSKACGTQQESNNFGGDQLISASNL